MTPEELKAIRERCEKATPGPWEVYCTFGSSDLPSEIVVVGKMGAIVQVSKVAKNPAPDMNFIAHARTDIPKLLEELEAQRKKFSEEDYQVGVKDGTLLANETLKQEIKVLKATVERLTRRIEIAPIRVDESVAGWAEAQEKDSSITAEDIYSKVGGVGSVATHFSKKIEEYYPPDRTVEDAVDEAWEKNRGSGNG